MNCLYCGKEFFESKSRRGFCSHHCWYESTKEKKICVKCGKEFMVAPKAIRQEVCEDCVIIKKICVHCGKEFQIKGGKQKFCSHVCFVSHNSIHAKMYQANYRRKNPRAVRKVFVERECVICGKVFMPRSSVHVSCSLRCSNRKLYERRAKLKPKTANHKWLISKELCECCGFNKKPALHAHHLSKNKMDVVVLCANCHYIFHSLVEKGLEFSYTKEQVFKMIQGYINKDVK